ncbi:MAG: hypothetical protein H6835_11100 [Planctomycetes bacterium]|nr:hypothetical protein [Planctomycetota bacterium]
MKRCLPAQFFAAALIATFATADLSAQCGHVAIPGFPHLGPDGPVAAVAYCDPDGSGNSNYLLFVGGEFDVVENTPCDNAALYDPASRTWTALPGGMFDAVTAAGRDINDMLLAAGSYQVGGSTLHRVARWNGTSWTVLGAGFDAPVRAVTNDGNEIYVGGEFTQCGGQPMAALARWNGSAWTAVGGGVTRTAGVASVQTISAELGTLYVGGAFDSAGSVAAANVARWNGTTWQAMGAGLPADVTSVVRMWSGDVFAAGLATDGPMQWNGTTWQSLPGLYAPQSGAAGPWVTAMSHGLSWNGEALFVAGDFDAGGWYAGVASWDQFGWNPIGGPFEFDGAAGPVPLAFDLLGNASGNPPAVAVAGAFGDQTGVEPGGVYVIDGYQDDAMGAGVVGEVLASGSLPNGDLLIGGSFQQIAGRWIGGLARSDAAGSAWASTQGVGQPSVAEVRAIVPTRDGASLLVGAFPLAGTTWADIVRYDGSTWTTFGTSPGLSNSAVTALEHSSGAIYLGGNVLSRYAGGSWTQLSTVQSGYIGSVFALAELPDGDVVVGGDLMAVGSAVRPGALRWSGNSWQPLGAGLTSVVTGASPRVLGARVRDDGVLFVVGTAGGVPFVSRFDGSNWQTLPAPATGAVRAIELLPDGDVVVGGEFGAIGGVAAASVARWDGAAWTAIGDGVRNLDGTPGVVSSLHFSRNGELQITGRFARHDGEVSLGFTRVRSLCAAATQSFGSGCSGSGGTNQLRSQNAAWLGGTMRSVATGMPNGGLVVDVLGLAPTFAPLPTPGCALWVDPLALGVAVPVAGRVESALAIPGSLALLGQVLYEQAIGVELTGGAITGLTGSNRLQQTIGVF